MDGDRVERIMTAIDEDDTVTFVEELGDFTIEDDSDQYWEFAGVAAYQGRAAILDILLTIDEEFIPLNSDLVVDMIRGEQNELLQQYILDDRVQDEHDAYRYSSIDHGNYDFIKWYFDNISTIPPLSQDTVEEQIYDFMREAMKQNYIEPVKFIHQIYLDKQGTPGWEFEWSWDVIEVSDNMEPEIQDYISSHWI